MDELRKQVALARRKLVLEQFLRRLVRSLFVAMIVALIALAIPRLVAIPNLPTYWTTAWLVGAVVAGILAAFVWTAVSNRSPVDAAIEIDHRFDLRERVASGLTLSSLQSETEAGQAVLNDALRAVRRIDVADGFPVRLERRAWLPLVPAALALMLVLFVNNRQAESSIDPANPQITKEQVKQSAESLRKKIAERRKNAEEKGLKEAEGLFKQIEMGTKQLTQKNDGDRKQATVKLNDLAKQIQNRRDQLGGSESLRNQLKNLNNMNPGPGDKFVKAVKQGDLKKALEQAKDLQTKLAQGKLGETEKQQLKEQLKQMQEKLAAAAEAHKQAMEDLKKQVEQAQRQGNLDQAGQLQQKLDQLAQQKPQMDMLKNMAQQLGQAQQGMEQANAQAAADAMSQIAEQLEQMQQQNDEMEMLDSALDQLEMTKSAMACQQCQGGGCKVCQGQGMSDLMGDKPGMGMGRGSGFGPRPDEENTTNLRDTRVRQNPGKGSAVFGGLVEGPNVKGDVVESIKEEMASLATEPEESVSAERLPRSRREHAEEYFRTLRDGQ
jgi:hypothetical protein